MIVKHSKKYRHKVSKPNFLGYSIVQLQRRRWIFWIDCIYHHFGISLRKGWKEEGRWYPNPMILPTATTFQYEVWDEEDFDMRRRLQDDLKKYLMRERTMMNQSKKLVC